jgi:WD40 repeat protein
MKVEGERAAEASFSPNGRWCMVTHGDKPPEVVDVDAGPGKPPLVLAEFPRGMFSCGFGPDNKTFVSIHFDGRIMFWQVPTGQRLRVLNLPTAGRTGNFTPDGRYFAASTDKGRVYIFRLAPLGQAGHQ